jgi:hypothetical protein
MRAAFPRRGEGRGMADPLANQQAGANLRPLYDNWSAFRLQFYVTLSRPRYACDERYRPAPASSAPLPLEAPDLA